MWLPTRCVSLRSLSQGNSHCEGDCTVVGMYWVSHTYGGTADITLALISSALKQSPAKQWDAYIPSSVKWKAVDSWHQAVYAFVYRELTYVAFNIPFQAYPRDRYESFSLKYLPSCWLKLSCCGICLLTGSWHHHVCCWYGPVDFGNACMWLCSHQISSEVT